MKNDSNCEIPGAEPFDELDARILAALEKTGAVIPVTWEAVKLAEEDLDESPISLPAHLQDPHSVLDKTRSQNCGNEDRKVVSVAPPDPEAIEKDLARAARKGVEISPDIKKMRRDPRMKNQIRELIRGLSPKHILSNSPKSYVDDFIAAAIEVYDPATLQKALQHKFYIPDESNYSDEAYYQNASELSVAHYIKQKENQNLVTNFELDKRVNPPSLKDVDNFFLAGSTTVSVEVKCPQEDKQAPFPGTITLKTAGRLPDPTKIDHMRDMLESGSSGTSGTKFAKGKNPDNRMKDCLLLANDKFSSNSGIDDLNILFISCGQFSNMNEWHMCLYGTRGLFTAGSFAPEARCPKVDIVMLSNLRYRHEQARAHPAWTL